MDQLRLLSAAFFDLYFQMAPYLLLGFFCAALLKVFVSDQFISNYLGKGLIRPALIATLFGIPLPLCSCGVVPAGLSLRQRGATKGATVSFLTSTPQTGVDSISVTYGFLGLPLALTKVLAALVTGVLSGVVIDLLESRADSQKQGKAAGSSVARLPLSERLKEGFLYGFVEMVQSVRRGLFSGLLLGGAIMTFLPQDLASSIGIDRSPVLLYLAMVAISVPMYVCAVSSVPIAVGLLSVGFTPGAALVFLMGGPATNAATIGILWRSLGKRTTILYTLNIILGALIFGAGFDMLFSHYAIPGLESGHGLHHHGSAEMLGWGSYLGGALLLLLIIWSFLAERLTMRNGHKEHADIAILQHESSAPEQQDSGAPGERIAQKDASVSVALQSNRQTMTIGGITCNGCVQKIKKRLAEEGAADISLSKSGACSFTLSSEAPPAHLQHLADVIETMGYQVQSSGTSAKA